jgi:hypothetical protein
VYHARLHYQGDLSCERTAIVDVAVLSDYTMDCIADVSEACCLHLQETKWLCNVHDFYSIT